MSPRIQSPFNHPPLLIRDPHKRTHPIRRNISNTLMHLRIRNVAVFIIDEDPRDPGDTGDCAGNCGGGEHLPCSEGGCVASEFAEKTVCCLHLGDDREEGCRLRLVGSEWDTGLGGVPAPMINRRSLLEVCLAGGDVRFSRGDVTRHKCRASTARYRRSGRPIGVLIVGFRVHLVADRNVFSAAIASRRLVASGSRDSMLGCRYKPDRRIIVRAKRYKKCSGRYCRENSPTYHFTNMKRSPANVTLIRIRIWGSGRLPAKKLKFVPIKLSQYHPHFPHV